MSLEVDARSHGVPLTFHQSTDSNKVFHDKVISGMPPPSSSRGKHNYGLGRSVLCLIIALLIMTTLAAVSAGLAGTYAKKRTEAVGDCSRAMKSMSALNLSPVSSTVIGAAAQSIQPTTSKTSLLSTPTPSLSAIRSPTSLTESVSPAGSLPVPSFQPIDECSGLGNIKSFPQGTEDRPVKFKINCGTDYPSAYSLLQVYVYTFKDCVNACASYNYNAPLHKNSTCAGVTYGTARSRNIGGNCFFMNDLTSDAVDKDKINSAIYLPDD